MKTLTTIFGFLLCLTLWAQPVQLVITGSGGGGGGNATNALLPGPGGNYDASLVTNLNGAAIQLNTVSSNALDAATRAMLGTGAGGSGPTNWPYSAITNPPVIPSTNGFISRADMGSINSTSTVSSATCAGTATNLVNFNTASIVTNGPFYQETGTGTDILIQQCEQASLNYENVGLWKYAGTNATIGVAFWTNAINRTNYFLNSVAAGDWLVDTTTNDVDLTTALFFSNAYGFSPTVDFSYGFANNITQQPSPMVVTMGGTIQKFLSGLSFQNSTLSGSVMGNVSGAMSGTFYGSYTGALSGFLLKLTNTISDFEGYGDSITKSNLCSGTNTFFNAYLAPELLRRFNCFITNGAQAGASIYQVSNQYAAYGHFITFPPNTTAIVSLEAGGNATSVSSNSLIGSFSNLCVQVHADGKKVLAYTVYGFPASGGLSVDQAAYNGWLRAATNYWDWLIDLDDIIDINRDLCDGIHPSTNGTTYRVFTNIMQTILPGSLVTQPVVVNEVLADTIYGTHIGTFTGNGSGLTNIPGSSIVGNIPGGAGGIVGIQTTAIMQNGAPITPAGFTNYSGSGSLSSGGYLTAYGDKVFGDSNATNAVTFSAAGLQLTNAIGTNMLAGGNITASGTVTASNFVGNGGGLTNLSPNNLSNTSTGSNVIAGVGLTNGYVYAINNGNPAFYLWDLSSIHRNWGLSESDVANGDFSIKSSSTAGGSLNSTRLWIAGITSGSVTVGNVGIGTTTPTATLTVQGTEIVSGTITTSNGIASCAPHTPVAVTVGASPFSYTNTTPVAQECYFSGGTAYSITKMGAAVYGSLIGNSYFVLQPTNYCVLTYTVAPTVFTNAW